VITKINRANNQLKNTNDEFHYRTVIDNTGTTITVEDMNNQPDTSGQCTSLSDDDVQPPELPEDDDFKYT